ASDPTANFEPAGGMAQDVIHFSVQGTFVPCEDIHVSAVTRRGSRIGRVELSGAIPAIPDALTSPDRASTTVEALVGELRRRRAGSMYTLSGDLALPPTIARNDIIGFEITRRFRQLDYDLVSPALKLFWFLGQLGDAPSGSPTSGTASLSA